MSKKSQNTLGIIIPFIIPARRLLQKKPSSFLYNNTPTKQFTFKDCIKLYYQRHVSKLKISTQQSLIAKKIYFYQSPLAKLSMSHLSAKKVDMWLEWLKSLNTTKNKSRMSFQRELSILCSILNWYKHYVDESFIVPILKRHKALCEYKIKKPRQLDYFARPEELSVWIKYLQNPKRDPVYWCLAQFMVLTGCRVGEATALLWEDFNFDNKTVDITKTLSWDYHNKMPYMHTTPKTTSSVRRIYLPKILIQMLKKIPKESTFNTKNAVFRTKDKKLLKYNRIQCHFNTAFKACKLPWRSTHICRHSYATMALMVTKNLSIVQACMGHSSQRTTERYAKIMMLNNVDIAEDIALFWKKHAS